MPIPFTTDERDAIAGRQNDFAKLEVTDPDGNWVDLIDGPNSKCWVTSCTISDSVDNNTMSFQASLKRGKGTETLAPLRTDSLINRDALDAYAPFLDVHRKWRAFAKVVLKGDDPDDYDWHEIGKGYYDVVDTGDTINLEGRGEEAVIIDTQILEQRTYSVGDADDIETVIQALLDDNMTNPPTLYVPVATSHIVLEYVQETGSLMEAIQRVAAFAGYVVRYRHDTADNLLTLFLPPREAEAGDENWTLGPSEYFPALVNRIDLTRTRNYIVVNFFNADTQAVSQVTSPTNPVSTSIGRYDLRAMVVDLLARDSVTGDYLVKLSAADAQALSDAMLSDLEFPPLLQQSVQYGFWFVQLCDYGKMLANEYYDDDQYGGVSAFSHSLANGTLRTTVDLGGQPRGGYKRWFPWGYKLSVMAPRSPTPVPNLPLPSGPGLSNILIWLRADSLLSSLVLGDPVSVWPDSSGNGNDAVQATGANQPHFETGIQNGLPVVQTATNDFMLTPEVIDPSAGATLFVVMRRNGTPRHGARFITFGNATRNGAGAGLRHRYSAPTDVIGWYYPETDFVGSVTDWHIIAVKIESLTSAIPFIDGGEEAAFDPSNDDIDGVGFGLFGLSIGACYDGSEPGDAQFAEIILASGDVNAQSRATVFSYLST
jgi:hypothetical protein